MPGSFRLAITLCFVMQLPNNAAALKCFVNGPISHNITPNVSMDCGNYMCSFGYSYRTGMVQRSCHPANVCSNGMSVGDYCQNVTDQSNQPMTYCCCTKDLCNRDPMSTNMNINLTTTTSSSLGLLPNNAAALKCFANGAISLNSTPNVTMDCGFYKCNIVYSYRTGMVQRSCHPSNVCSNGISIGDYCANVTDRNNQPMTYCCCSNDLCNRDPMSTNMNINLTTTTSSSLVSYSSDILCNPNDPNGKCGIKKMLASIIQMLQTLTDYIKKKGN